MAGLTLVASAVSLAKLSTSGSGDGLLGGASLSTSATAQLFFLLQSPLEGKIIDT